ncbi:substrate-binding domain-containing protein [Allonocardiopsis opalescens]|uniref:von Willebrand factor type A domain-containing protein n=1 Tax=Allonocardiopsis opalescens TaxID=1144618 RepID=A0A2T0PVF5_9ACTN|nr:substrate-binding domain-containing protein [Allonocardiopsis opalescens]PRX95487.1 von Willebrand factor type A domain-containing protein [Allonocardiopsis opalescens]
MATGRHRIDPRTRRRVAITVATATAVAVLLVAGGAALLSRWPFGCGETRYLRVAATVSMAPVLQEAAREFNDDPPTYGGVCVYAQVNEAQSATVLNGLAGAAGTDPAVPDVWIPESSGWVELARTSERGAEVLSTSPVPLATSPIVVAAPASADGLPDPERADWEMVLPDALEPDRDLRLVDPNRGVSGMAAVHAARDLLGDDDAADVALTEFVRDAQPRAAVTSDIDLRSVYGAEPDPSGPLTVVPEQSVWQYNAGAYPAGRTPGGALAAHYPDGLFQLDFPYVRASTDPVKVRATDDFYALLRTERYTQALLAAGFRTPEGEPGAALRSAGGLAEDLPFPATGLPGSDLVDALFDWNQLAMPTRALILADVSEQTGEPLSDSDSRSRLEIAVDAARLGLRLFPDDTDMGLWLFADGVDADDGHSEVVELGPLRDDDPGTERDDRRERLLDAADGIAVEGGGSRLYDTLLDGYEEATENFHAGRVNSLIVLTAGRDGGSSDITGDELVEELSERFDPQRPVTLFIIAFGDQGERSDLERIADATSGTVYVTDDASEIGDIFVNAISRRLCVPDCSN